MRWCAAGAIAVVVAWTIYLASPYWAAATFAVAVARGDLATVATRVNLRALRISLTKQLVSEGLVVADLDDAISAADAQIAAGALAIVADPLITQFATARGVVDLAREIRVDDLTPSDVGANRPGAFARMADYIQASRWRGFRNVYVTLPRGRPPDEQVRLQFRLSRFAWRLVSLDLPAASRRRLAAKIAEVTSSVRRPGLKSTP